MFLAVLLTVLAVIGIYFFFFGGVGFGLWVFGSSRKWPRASLGIAIILTSLMIEVYLIAVTIEEWVDVIRNGA